MSDMQRNEGVIVTGGSLSAGVMAVGQHAQVVVNGTVEALKARDQPDVAAKLEELLDTVRANGAELPDQAEALKMTERVAEELGRDEPDGITVQSFLTRLTSMVGSAGQVAAAVTALAHAVAIIL